MHTKGEWKITKCPCGECEDYNVNDWFMQGGMVSLDDAQLIASAPDLYLTCKKIVQAKKDGWIGLPIHINEMLQHAINKVEGDPNAN